MSQQSVTSKTSRTYESSSGSSGGINYTPVTKSRSSTVRSSLGGMGGFGGGSGAVSRTVTMSYPQSQGSSMGNAGVIAEAGVKNIVDNRTSEKKSMQDLNSRFANYIEKNRFLEAQLKSVEQRLKDLQSKWGKETEVVKQMYEAELKKATDLYNDSEKEKARVELKCQSLEDQLADYRRRLDDMERLRQQDKDTINRQNQQLADYESELNMLRRRVNGLEQDLEHESSENKRMQEELFKTVQERDAERLLNIELENQVQALQEEIEFLKNLHEQEMNELRALIGQDSYKDNRKFWEGEMSNAIRELQSEFDRRLEHQNQQMQSYYQMKVQESKTGQAKDASKVEHLMSETKRLQSIINDMKNQMGDLEGRNSQLERQYADLLRQHEDDMRAWDEEKNRYETDIHRLTAECEKLLREMEAIMDSKLSLELEIAAYRKLLEVEETRLDAAQQAANKITSTTIHTVSSHMSGGSSGGSGSGGSRGYSYNVDLEASSGGLGHGLAHGQGQSSSQSMSIKRGSSSSSESQQAIMTGQMSQKTTFQRSAKGPLAISQVDPAGNWIEVENTGRKEESIGGWRVGRKVDGKNVGQFAFPEGMSLGNTKDSRSVKVYAKDKGPAGSLEYERDNWGTGSQVTTTLMSPSGEDKATHIQKTTYAQ
ncbi:60 kDa neurofilament protein-like isoform X1 [Watersipora subatra]|uniref:60 kDa neurofilament protein-like isoform X1 n=1 Tax=Watersipora subatra TaxID=2589382 RepID=UPI00355AD82F